MQFNIYDAKTNFSRLIDKVLEGKEVIIAKAGKPVAKIITYKEKTAPRKLGLLKGKISVPDDFDEENQEINKIFYGE